MLTFLTQFRDIDNFGGKHIAGCHFDALSDHAESAPGGGEGREAGGKEGRGVVLLTT